MSPAARVKRRRTKIRSRRPKQVLFVQPDGQPEAAAENWFCESRQCRPVGSLKLSVCRHQLRQYNGTRWHFARGAQAQNNTFKKLSSSEILTQLRNIIHIVVKCHLNPV